MAGDFVVARDADCEVAVEAVDVDGDAVGFGEAFDGQDFLGTAGCDDAALNGPSLIEVREGEGD